jgi:preprotein translocase subunit SecE
MLRVRVLPGLYLKIWETEMGKIVQFFKESVAELKKVVWPGKDDVVSSVKVVLISTLVVAVVLGLLDLLFVTGMNLIF